MIRFSKELDYAIQLIVKLAQLSNEELLSLKSFSESREISFLFLQKIARTLKSANIITSARGSQGGYKLARPPEKITLRDIIEAFEGKYAPVDCLRGKVCKRRKDCPTRKFSACLHTDILQVLDKYTVKDIQDIYECK
ncbi:MAG: Rrf2 family transcriptional regulator [Candidatus Magasanikbacteria bacterium]